MHKKFRLWYSAAPIALLVLLCGCEAVRDKHPGAGVSMIAEPETKADIWTAVATDADESRLDRLGLAWQSALADALPRYKSQIDGEGVLLEPRAALPRPAPTPGSYNCRMVKLGSANDSSTARNGTDQMMRWATMSTAGTVSTALK